jgi:exopolysaccharide biosynthesis polyprenyl glycosylphosphotransferase
MIRNRDTGPRLALVLVDAALAVAVMLTVFGVRFGLDWDAVSDQLLPHPTLFAPTYAIAWVSLLAANGLYRPSARWSMRSTAAGVVAAAALLALGMLAALFLLDLTDVSRLALLAIFPAQAAVTIASRVALRAVLRAVPRRSRNPRSLLIIGTGPDAVAFAARIRDRWDLGLHVAGFLGAEPVGEPAASAAMPHLGTTDLLPDILRERVIHEVAICLPLEERELIDQVYRLCADEGKTIRIPVQLPVEALAGAVVEDLDGMPILSLASAPDHVAGLAMKRAIDIAGAVVGLVLLSPVFALSAIAIAATDGRPVIFRQQRVGVHGRRFSIVKFRTMTRNADAQRAALRAHNEIEGGASFKMTNDPRITPIGRLLRKTSIDELPQLWNVLRGEMSLVGPRPHPLDDVAGYSGWHRRRLTMKPGITGLWQIAGRQEASFDRWVEMDLEYIDRWSIWLDLRLILQTIPAMLRAEGR